MTDQLTPGPSPTIIAPDARTILAVLALAERVTIPIDDATRDWLANNGLAQPGDDYGRQLDLTPRAHAWLGSLLAVPLPVQRTQWVDPRGDVAPATIPVTDLAKALRDALVPLYAAPRSIAPQPKASAPASAPRPAAVPFVDGEDGFPVIDPLPGFVPPDQTMRMTQPGTPPPGWQRDDTVVVQRRNGKMGGERGQLTGSQVIWGEKGDGDDVLFYRRNGRPADETPGTRVG